AACLRRVFFLCFFFFSSRRRHTRFSRDWSSDVCSSDLTGNARAPRTSCSETAPWKCRALAPTLCGTLRGTISRERISYRPVDGRSEERRVGKECRYRGSPEH